MEKKNLYPLKFIPQPVWKDWGGNALIKRLGKRLVETDGSGNETLLTEKDRIGESWEIADMGFIDSVAENGWLSGNTISEIMETYIERISGDDVYQYYGRLFPVLVKFLDIQGKTSIQVNPDDEAAEQRYDSLGKSKVWYIMEASENARLHLGFKRDISARELYDKCQDGSIHEEMNEIKPQKGEAFFIAPGIVHYAEGGMLIAEIQESSDLTFRLFDWGREKDPGTARPMHLEEAFDLIHLGQCDISLYRKNALSQEQARSDSQPFRPLFSLPQFTVREIGLKEPVKIRNEESGSFSIYIGIEGEASIQVPAQNPDGGKRVDEYRLKKGESILIPADIQEFFIVPTDRDTILIETFVEKRDEPDEYINPETEPYLEGEDYGGVEDFHDEDADSASDAE